MAILAADFLSCIKRNLVPRLCKTAQTQLAGQVFLFFMLSISMTSVPVALAGGKIPVDTAAVLGPLELQSTVANSPEMIAFNQLLQEARDIGVQAVTIDVWWRKVEVAGDQNFDWSYYDAVFNAVRSKGLFGRLIKRVVNHQGA